jgi:hypothetical protein
MDHPLRPLAPEEIDSYDEDGVVLAKGLFPSDWLRRMQQAVDRVTASPTFYGNIVSMKDQDFSGDLFLWKQDDDFRDWVYESPAARIAQQVLRTKTVRHLYDQLFVKPAGCHVATPWHHDVTFWPVPVECRALCSIWISFDAVDREASGLEFVRGSHRWPQFFKAVTPNYDPYMMDSEFEDPPDVDSHRDDYDLYSPAVEPGDCLIFNAHILHGSTGNYTTDQPRRAFSTRWFGEGVTLEERYATMPLMWEHGLEEGDALAGPLFPQVLPAVIPGEAPRRSGPPEPPDPSRLARMAEVIAGRSPKR